MLFVALRDYLKKIKESANDEKKVLNSQPKDESKADDGKDISAQKNTNEVPTEEKVQSKDDGIIASIKKHREIKKQQKALVKEKKKEEGKDKTLFFYYTLAMIVVFCLILGYQTLKLTTSETYTLYGTLQYNVEHNSFEIKYDIESLKNSPGFSAGQEVCVFMYSKSTDRVNTQENSCVKGVIESVFARTSIHYPGLPKYISFDALKLYLNTSSSSNIKNVSRVMINLKQVSDSYQIFEIIPK